MKSFSPCVQAAVYPVSTYHLQECTNVKRVCWLRAQLPTAVELYAHAAPENATLHLHFSSVLNLNLAVVTKIRNFFCFMNLPAWRFICPRWLSAFFNRGKYPILHLSRFFWLQHQHRLPAKPSAVVPLPCSLW